MASSPANIVVGLSLRVEADLNMFRIRASIQATGGGRSIYNEEVQYFTTWLEVLTWLGTLLSEEDAATPLAIT
jgi:hypothetical protein